MSEKRGCVRWEGEFRISQRHCPSPLALAPTILEPGPRLKKKEIKAARYQCGHPPGQRGPPWAVSWWGEPGSRVNLLALFAPRPSHGSLQIPSNAHSTGVSASLAEVERRRWQGSNCYVLVGPPYLAKLKTTALEYSALPPPKMASTSPHYGLKQGGGGTPPDPLAHWC